MTCNRQTQYKTATIDYIKTVGHATNAEVLAHLRISMPKVSATTVHRVTSGLVVQKKLTMAPPSLDNSARFDANLQGHDHFECVSCGCLRDINLPQVFLMQLDDLLADCKFSGHINIQGICGKCNKKEKNL